MPAIWAAVIGAGASLAGGAIAGAGAEKGQKGAAAARAGAFGDAQSFLSRMAGGGMGSLEEMFGSKLDPEAFLYHPVDITQSQLDTIQGNIRAFPSALQLTNSVNPSIWRNDLNRIRELMPTYDDSRDLFLGATKSLLAGQLPFQDVEDIVSNRSGISGMLGTPGGGRNATLRDLGMSRLQATQTGGSMFQQFVQMAEQISPVGAQMRPQQMMFSPQERLNADIEQRALQQQGMASAEMARAMPDPAQNALANAQIGLQFAGLGGNFSGGAGMGMQGLGQGIAAAGGMFGALAGQRQQQPTPSLYGGMNISASPFGGQQSYYGGGGGGYSPSAPQAYSASVIGGAHAGFQHPASYVNPSDYLNPGQQPNASMYPATSAFNPFMTPYAQPYGSMGRQGGAFSSLTGPFNFY